MADLHHGAIAVNAALIDRPDGFVVALGRTRWDAIND